MSGAEIRRRMALLAEVSPLLWEQVADVNNPVDWVLLGFEAGSKKLSATSGEGGVAAVKDRLKDNEVSQPPPKEM